MVFDKTGTLTEENLRIKSHITNLESHMIEAMSLCHSISKMENERLIGDPLDIEMFNYVQTLADVDLNDQHKPELGLAQV